MCLVLLALLGSPGCAARRPAGLIAWDLARPLAPGAMPRWYSRLAEGYTLPVGITERLCDEFEFAHVRTPAQWHRLCRVVFADGRPPSGRLDFNRGSVVALIARVGDPADGKWPLTLEEARVVDGEGWLRFQLATGLYYPVSSGAYFIAYYVPGLKVARIVQVNKRIFGAANPM
ncbi:MAG: hypothetical protein ACPMAQ_08415 [Phycisphaerae bacterium]